MTRHDADKVQPDAGEIVVGRITNAGGYDLRYRPTYDQPEPEAEVDPDVGRITPIKVLGLTVFVLFLYFALGLGTWVAFGGQPSGGVW